MPSVRKRQANPYVGSAPKRLFRNRRAINFTHSLSIICVTSLGYTRLQLCRDPRAGRRPGAGSPRLDGDGQRRGPVFSFGMALHARHGDSHGRRFPE